MRSRSLPFISRLQTKTLLDVVVLQVVEMTERQLERVYGHTIKELEYLLNDACELFDGNATLEDYALGGWSNVNIRGQSEELEFVLKLPCSIVSQNPTHYKQLFDVSLFFSKLGIAPRPITMGNLSNSRQTPFIIFEYIEGVIHESVTELSPNEISALKRCLQTISRQKPPSIRRYSSPSDHMTTKQTLVENHEWRWKCSTELNALIDSFNLLHPELSSYADELGGWESTVMHGDLWIPNLVFQADNVIVLDFEDCAYGNHLYDLAFLLETPESTVENLPPGIVLPEEADDVDDLRPIAVAYIINWSLERLLSMEAGFVEPNISTEKSRSAVTAYTRSKIKRMKTLLY